MQLKLTNQEGESFVIKCEKGQQMQQLAIDPNNYPNLVAMLTNLDSTNSCTGVDVVDYALAYCVSFYISEGWSMVEKDKGMPKSYYIDEEGVSGLTEAQKEEIQQLENLL